MPTTSMLSSPVSPGCVMASATNVGSDPVPIILDCDPGHDNAVAIMLASGCPSAELLGMTTIAGNQTLERTTRNASVVATVAGIDVPIAAGPTGRFHLEQASRAEAASGSAPARGLATKVAMGLHAEQFWALVEERSDASVDDDRFSPPRMGETGCSDATSASAPRPSRIVVGADREGRESWQR